MLYHLDKFLKKDRNRASQLFDEYDVQLTDAIRYMLKSDFQNAAICHQSVGEVLNQLHYMEREKTMLSEMSAVMTEDDVEKLRRYYF